MLILGAHEVAGLLEQGRGQVPQAVRAAYIAHAEGRAVVPSLCDGAGRVTVFSPFGLGILDLAVARLAAQQASERGSGLQLNGFALMPSAGFIHPAVSMEDTL